LRSFYQRQSGDWPWMLVIAYAVSFTALLIGSADFTHRAYLAVGGLQVVFCLVLREFFKGMSGPLARRYPRWTFGRWI
ncbi:hypothetical protein ABTE00_22405, partial [Acinetobacter baumannii]